MCLDDQILNTYLDEELTEPWKTQVEEHLSYCSACQKRFSQLKTIHNVVSQSRLDENEIAVHKEKVLNFIEKNYIEKKGKVSFFHRDFRIKTPLLLSTAAAFIFILAGALLFTNSAKTEADQLIPAVLPTEGTVIQVRSTEGLAASQVLEHFSLEEILKYLDSKGYDVDLKLRNLQLFNSEEELLDLSP